MDWLYRFTSNNQYPDPVEEIDALCTLDDDGNQVFLLLANRPSPPMTSASKGDLVGLCTGKDGVLILEGLATVDGECIEGQTPCSVQPIYGVLANRTFLPLTNLIRKVGKPLDETVLSASEQRSFLNGQAFVKNLSQPSETRRTASETKRSDETPPSQDDNTERISRFNKIKLPQHAPKFTVIGLDPTAGTWGSGMKEGPKKRMPSFSLEWNGVHFQPSDDPLNWHLTNQEFWETASKISAVLACIDGPCGTNGPELADDGKGWKTGERHGTRSGELELSRDGINLFWTTQNTVMKFEGASRWIARSLVLFSEEPQRTKIETHPHGAFTFLWRLLGNCGALPKKSKSGGMKARLAMLRSFIPDIAENLVPNHDAMDAACAALVAGLHQLGMTKSFGSVDKGGMIWMPDIEKLKKLVHEVEEVASV